MARATMCAASSEVRKFSTSTTVGLGLGLTLGLAKARLSRVNSRFAWDPAC